MYRKNSNGESGKGSRRYSIKVEGTEYKQVKGWSIDKYNSGALTNERMHRKKKKMGVSTQNTTLYVVALWSPPNKNNCMINMLAQRKR